VLNHYKSFTNNINKRKFNKEITIIYCLFTFKKNVMNDYDTKFKLDKRKIKMWLNYDDTKI
jgi:hypothetical protein